MAALQAGVMNVPFVPVRGLLGTDYMRVRPDFKEIANPYDPRERIALVPAIAPDVAVFHGWQGDRFGNVVANAAGDFSYSGPLPAGEITVFAASTLDDPAHPTRIGSSSEWSGATTVISGSAEPLLSSLGSTIDLSGVATGPAHPGDMLRFNITMVNIGPVAVTNINSTVFQESPTVTLLAQSHKMTGGAGFVATDSGLVGTPNHPDAMAMAAKGLRAAGFSEDDLNWMFKKTPARLIGLPVQ